MDYDSQCPVWYFDRLDKAGPFAFDTSRPDFQHREFLDKMIAYSNMTWAEIKRQTHDKGKSKHHMLDESGFSPAAWERIKAKHLEEETDAIFSFAFQNLLRIIGVRRNAEFHVVESKGFAVGGGLQCSDFPLVNKTVAFFPVLHIIMVSVCKRSAWEVGNMATVFDVAKYILEQRGKLSTMKLQKLCYYAQAWSLVWDDEPLFDEDFEAWANGPVCPELFSFSKGQFAVTPEEMRGDSANLSNGQKDTIDEVLRYYGDKNAQWLSQLTHMEDPWKDARQGLLPGQRCNSVVSKESMAMYYGGL